VTGDGHQGIGLSGVSCSAFGSRLRVPAADGRKAEAWIPDARGRHPSPENGQLPLVHWASGPPGL